MIHPTFKQILKPITPPDDNESILNDYEDYVRNLNDDMLEIEYYQYCDCPALKEFDGMTKEQVITELVEGYHITISQYPDYRRETRRENENRI